MGSDDPVGDELEWIAVVSRYYNQDFNKIFDMPATRFDYLITKIDEISRKNKISQEQSWVK